MGGSAGPADIAGSTLGRVNDMYSERKARTAELKNIRTQKAINEKKKKNILEEQLAKRRAKVGSMGISTSGSSIAVQNKIVSDAYEDISYDNHAYDTQYAKTYNAYQAKLRSQIIGDSSNAAKTIK